MLSAHITSTLLACTAAVHALPQNYQYQYEPQNNEFNYEYKAEGEVAEVIGPNPYINDPENYGKPWSYEYKYDPNQNQFAYAYDPAKNNYTFSFDGSGANPGNVVDSVAASLTSLQKVVENPAIVRALGLIDADCTIVADTKEALEDTQSTLEDNKPLLVKTLNDIQGLRSRSQQSAGDVIRTLSTALGDVEGLLPTFTKLFTFNNDCNFVKDEAISRRRRQAAEGECADPKAFSRDIFSGVADLIDFAVELNNETPSAAVRNNELKEQAELIRDGADLLEDVDFTPLLNGVTFNANCPTSISEVRRSLNQLADLADLITPEPQPQPAAVFTRFSGPSFVPAVPARAVTPFVAGRRPNVVVPQYYY